MEQLIALDLQPGLSSNGTKYQNRNRWVDGSLVRFHEGSIRPVGGWVINRDTNGGDLHVVGTPRGSLGWRDNSSTGWIAVGTTGKPLARMAVAWVLAHPAITAPIVGASRPEQLDDVLPAVEKGIDATLKAQLDELTREYRWGDDPR